jgi:hypothetical protein
MLEQSPTDKNAASSNNEKRAADNRQHERGDDTANGFRGWDGDADNAADCHEDETRDNEERTSNNPEDAESAEVPIKTAGQGWGNDRGNRALAIGANAEIGLNLGSAGTAEHTYLLGMSLAFHITLGQTVDATSDITRATGPFVR